MATDGRPLSATTVRILRAAVAAIRPRGHGFDQAIDDDVLAKVVAFFPYLPTPMRLSFPMGLRLLELGPAAVLKRPARFSSLPADQARARHLGIQVGQGEGVPVRHGRDDTIRPHHPENPWPSSTERPV